MTRRRPPAADDVIGTRPPLTFGLFAEMATIADSPRARPTVHAPGAGQRARSDARARAAAHTAETYRLLDLALAASHPYGLTRTELAAQTHIPQGTVNGRIADGMLRATPPRYVTEGARAVSQPDGRVATESIVHLAHLRTTPTEE